MIQIDDRIFMWSKGTKTSKNHSYLIQRKNGNYFFGNFKGNFPVKRELDEIESLGGIDHIFLTHRDEATTNCERVQDRFDATLHLHEADLEDTQKRSGAEFTTFKGSKFKLFKDLTAYHLPGHSKGFCYYVYHPSKQAPILFSGDMPYISEGALSWKTCRPELYKDFVESLPSMKNIKFEKILSCVSKGAENTFPHQVDQDLKERLFNSMESWAKTKLK